jgi:hypothetical protein
MGGPVERISNRCDRTPCNVTWAAAGDSPRDRQNKKGRLGLVEEAVEKVRGANPADLPVVQPSKFAGDH